MKAVPETEDREGCPRDGWHRRKAQADVPERERPDWWTLRLNVFPSWGYPSAPFVWAFAVSKKDVPETDVAETDAPETNVPETDVPETDGTETDVPETDGTTTEAPETDIPETVEGGDGGP